MSRKDYVEAARILSSVPMPAEVHSALVARFVTMFADENPRFSPPRFREACEPDTTDDLEVGCRACHERPEGQWCDYHERTLRPLIAV